jgi:hypothetical protein
MRTSLVLGTLLALGSTSCGEAKPATIIVTAAGFGQVEGKAIRVAVVDTSANALAVQPISGVITGGAYTTTIQLPPDVAYRVDAFVDDDGDTYCQWGDPAIDHAYSVDVAPVAEGKTFNANLAFADTSSRGCLSYGDASMHLKVTNLNAGSAPFYIAALVRVGTPDLVVGKFTGGVPNGTIDTTFEGAVVPGMNYRVDFYVEKDGRVGCTSGDLTFRVLPKFTVTGPPSPGITKTVLDLTVDGTAAQTPEVCTSTLQ